MRRVGIVLGVGVLLAISVGGARAQQLGVPPGRWWERPRVAEQISLTAEQRQRLNDETNAHARVMVDLKGAVEKAEIDLRVAAEAVPFSGKPAREAFATLQRTRQKLEAERFEMLIKVREVLTPEQWSRLQELARTLAPKVMEERRDSGAGMQGERPRSRRRL